MPLSVWPGESGWSVWSDNSDASLLCASVFSAVDVKLVEVAIDVALGSEGGNWDCVALSSACVALSVDCDPSVGCRALRAWQREDAKSVSFSLSCFSFHYIFLYSQNRPYVSRSSSEPLNAACFGQPVRSGKAYSICLGSSWQTPAL